MNRFLSTLVYSENSLISTSIRHIDFDGIQLKRCMQPSDEFYKNFTSNFHKMCDFLFKTSRITNENYEIAWVI